MSEAIPNPEYENLRNYLVVGYQYHGDTISAFVDQTTKATKEEIDESWRLFEERRLAYDPYKVINTGPLPIRFKDL